MLSSDEPKSSPGRSIRRRGRPAGRTTADGVIADRRTLLTAAERLIRRLGPDVSLEAIAAAAGVTKPILYRGVGGRDALVDALADRLNRRITRYVAGRVADAADAHDALRRLVGGYLAYAARERHLYLYVTAAAGDDRMQSSLLLADRAAQALAQAIAAHRSAQGADATAALTWAYGLVGALHFVTLWWLRDRALDIEQATEQITALFWSGLALPMVARGSGKKR
jgi:AcrR family transcriptional regulator